MQLVTKIKRKELIRKKNEGNSNDKRTLNFVCSGKLEAVAICIAVNLIELIMGLQCNRIQQQVQRNYHNHGTRNSR